MAETKTTDARGVLICANPYSGSGPNRRHVDELVAELDEKDFEPKLVWDLNERNTALSDPGLGDWCRCVVVAGGDGSIQDVVNEMPHACSSDPDGHKGVAFATLPMGTENLFAKYFGFSRDVESLADAIEKGRTRLIDLGQVSRPDPSEQRLFTLMTGVGFDGEVVHRMQHWRTARAGLRRVSRTSYLPRITCAFMSYKYPALKVRVDDRELAGAMLIVFNLPMYGGGLKFVSEDCSVDDGLLDWVLFEKPGILSMASYAQSVIRGKHRDRKDVQHGRSASLTVSSVEPAPVQIDGDPFAESPIEIGICEDKKLELLII